VTQLAAGIQPNLLAMRDVFRALLRLSDFMIANKDKLEISDTAVTAKDPATQAALQPLFDDARAKRQALVQALQQIRGD